MINPENVITFLEDEGLADALRVKHEDTDEWMIVINEPSIFGTNDSKQRCGIFQKEDIHTGKLEVYFNAFKAVGLYGADYKGTFWKFVKLVKDFDSINEAKQYFLRNYILKGGGRIDSYIVGSNYEKKRPKEKHSIELPESCLRFEWDNSDFSDYIIYLNDRGIHRRHLKNKKIFIDPEQKRIVFPVYENGELVFHTGRTIDDDNPLPWLKSEGEGVYPIWNLENVNGDIIYIFEGIFDALLQPNGVAILGATYTGPEIVSKILYNDYYQINIILDNDEPGWRAKMTLARELEKAGHKNIWVYNFIDVEEKDFSLMKKNNTPCKMDERLLKWSLQTEVLYKMGKFK